MYRYTPRKELLKTLLDARKKPYSKNGSAEWNLANSLLLDYKMKTAFLMYWEGVDQYSLTRLTKVPVYGILFPVDYFDETIV